MKILRNKWVRAIIVILGVILAVYLAVVAKLAWDGYQKQARVDKFQEMVEKPFREDVYGGKTPEETWAMFLDALKKEDFALASKYYDVEHQTEARKWLEGLKERGELGQMIKEMRKLKKVQYTGKNKWLNKITDRKDYYYDYFDHEFNQTLSSSVNFYLNQYTKVWKIVW